MVLAEPAEFVPHQRDHLLVAQVEPGVALLVRPGEHGHGEQPGVVDGLQPGVEPAEERLVRDELAVLEVVGGVPVDGVAAVAVSCEQGSHAHFKELVRIGGGGVECSAGE